jgi:hypothetical protein
MDTNGPVMDNERPCTYCGKMPTPEGHDACLGRIPDVIHACCGHGVRPGYLIKTNGYRMLLPKIGTKPKEER